MSEGNKQATTLILFGATGDLAKRKLYPALYRLYKKQNHFAVIGVARRDISHDDFRAIIQESLENYTHRDDDIQDFVQKFFYYALDVKETEGYTGLKSLCDHVDSEFGLKENRMFYLSLAPEFFAPVTLNLQASGLTDNSGWKKLVIEKPFGRDLKSANELNEAIHNVFKEDEIYRIDHYLGKEMVQNIQVIRFANPIFESIWNNRYISNVQITSSETLGVGERASYYDHTGALMDMVQNHMLQMVALTAMEPPSRFETEDIRDEKVKVLRSVRQITTDDIAGHIIKGQYTRGTMPNGNVVKGYREEDNIKEKSMTETFVAAKLFIDNFRWAGVPFYIRTGKRMTVKSTEIVIQFKDAPQNPYFNNFNDIQPNLLVIHVQPDEGLSLKLNAKKFSSSGDTMPITMEFSNSDLTGADAYERLIQDCLNGDSTNFTRWDEVALSWEFVDSITKAWNEKNIPLDRYESGSMGPASAYELLDKDGLHWWPLTKVEK
ncbi:glucose-6-phosphate 1-dehydrogenase [Scopulibacillus darangshiensis]|uniref:Glucose-6-phosphate 1-dehydrogenase n=1 Tax=Scopulibacillus darangshiensis TaxID=442528 RepID=A0A4R2NZG3_9BACL|nr:glucose-6-phosphate dehydrogenase [Scopulibacillus darangshiensis]TCP27044.1 glucose-6-phosphate 1-dehydrogenase [Scopulibacillus darangshiensis]